MAVIELEGVNNVRDLGGIPVEDGGVVRSGLLFRGGALTDATEADRNLLFDELGIACIIDLRCGWEAAEHPSPLPEGVEYLHIPFYDLDKVGIEYDRPAPGTHAIGRDVAIDPDDYYRELANPLTVRQMREALAQTLGHACTGKPVYLHCSGGKDRTGILSLLVLHVLGATRDDILADYLLTNVARDRRYDEVLERFRRYCDTEQRAIEITELHRARPENLDAFYESVSERYGSMESFVRNELGIDEARANEVRSHLISR